MSPPDRTPESPLDVVEPATADKLEALSREVERLRVLASRERGLTEAILTHSPYGILVSDAQGKLTLQNRACERMWAGSASADSVAGWAKYRAFHPDGRPFEPSDFALARVLADKRVVEARELHIQRFDGTRGVLLAGSAPIFGPDGELTGALSIFTDITAAKQQEAELRLSSERYFTTLRSVGDAVIATDATGRIDFLNPIAEALTGFALAEALGKPLREVFRIVNEHSRAEVESPVDKVIREGKIVGLANHTILIARDGSERAIDDSGAPILNAQAELVGVVLVFRDVTEKRREEDVRRFIAEASALLVSSLDYAPTLASVAKLAVPTIADWAAVDVVEDGKLERLAVVHVDPAKVQLAKQMEQRYPADPRSPYGVHEAIRSGSSLLMAEIPEALIVKLARDAEHLALVLALGLTSLMIVPMRCRGRTIGAISFVSAESKRRFGPSDLQLAEELARLAALAVDNARLYREAQAANRTKDEFLATVSHELRTPLNAMLGWANLLRSSSLSQEKRDHALETIERNARNQSRLVEDLLDVSRIISGNLRLEPRSVDLIAVIEAATDALRPSAEAKGVAIELELDQSARLATGDPGRLQQVVWNLLSNAIKFSHDGGKIELELASAEAAVELRVSDTGRGIDAEFLPHVFERFKQGNGSTTRSQGGLGLGLSIVKHLVELHHGQVSAESAGLNRGARFVVRLPLLTLAPREPVPGSVSMRMLAPSLRGLSVLVVDDEPDSRGLLVAVLEQHGASVIGVGSAAEALRELERAEPDVLVSDIAMPEQDGYSLIRQVRARTSDRPKPLPAVALTAYARREDRARALLAGFQSHVAKPVEPDELLIVVATLAGRTE